MNSEISQNETQEHQSNQKLSIEYSRDVVNFCVYCFAYCKHYITE